MSTQFKSSKLNYTKASTTTKGIKIKPSSVEHYRAMITLLKYKLDLKYHTYDLNCEKPLKVVLRGVIQELSEDEIKTDREAQGYPAHKISRLTGRNKQPDPLVSIEIEREYKSIYNLKHCCGLSITVEPLHVRTETSFNITGAKNSDTYKKNCNADYKCLKCDKGHSTHLCTKQKTTPAKCANSLEVQRKFKQWKTDSKGKVFRPLDTQKHGSNRRTH